MASSSPGHARPSSPLSPPSPQPLRPTTPTISIQPECDLDAPDGSPAAAHVNSYRVHGPDDTEFSSSPPGALLSPHLADEPYHRGVDTNLLSSSHLAVPSYDRSLIRRPKPERLHLGAMADEKPPVADGSSSPANPFNFQTQTISTAPVKSGVGQRRGHRYKHSSVSAQHQIFKEPPQRPPPVLPASLPIPTLRDARERMTTEQWHSLYWSLCHLAVAAFLFFRSKGSLGIMALSHLVFFDAGSALICVAVDVLGNFEVWRRSSIRHPFGLERAEVIAGFAMSIFLLFGGFDLVSHGLKHWLENKGDHEPHHEHTHGHEYVPTGEMEWIACAAIVSTLVSAYWVKNHGRIARIMRTSWLLILSRHFSNVFHVLTIFFSCLVLLLPLLPGNNPIFWDRALCAAIAGAMFVFGVQLGMAQGSMLLMSYRGDKRGDKSVSAVLREIEVEPNVTRVEDAQFWQVHYGLCMANLTVLVSRGCDEGSISKLRGRVSSLIQNRLGEGYGRGSSLRWEVTIQTSVDPN